MTQLFKITVPTKIEESTSSLIYDFAVLSKPIFFNSEAYNSFNPVIKQVFNNNDDNAKISTCDFMTYMFPIDNTIEFTDNQNVIIKYTPYYIHFTRTCPIIFTNTPSMFSLIIECMSVSNIPLLIIIPVDYTSGDSNTTVDLLIKHTQSTQSSIAAAPANNIYLNNIIPPEKFIYFKKPVSTGIVNCNIITFQTSLKTHFSPETDINKISALPSLNFNEVDTSLTDNKVNTLISPDVDSALYIDVPTPPSTASSTPSIEIIVPIRIYKSSNTPYNSPSIAENDIYIDCSVVTDTTTPTTTILPTTSTPSKNSAAFIMFLIIIFITSLFIYKWIFMSNTSISKPPSSKG
jgi:hypothetical protein